LFLAHAPSQPDGFNAIAEFFAKGRQALHLWAECRSYSAFSPPNEITGRDEITGGDFVFRFPLTMDEVQRSSFFVEFKEAR